jgi:hypothetical protein
LDRERRVVEQSLKESEREELETKGCSLEDERRGEREESKGLKAKREVERGGKERRVLAEAMREMRNGVGSERWRSGFRSMRRTMRWVLE